MNSLYKSIGITKQGFHQRLDRWLKMKSAQEQLLLLVYRIREDHPTMGLRDMYYKIQPEFIGRDAFERFCKSEGLSSERPKNWAKTTDSSGVIRFENLLTDLAIDKINQVWQSDITYFEIDGKFYYITFIIDAFSRLIVGHVVSKRLLTEQTTLPALRMAINKRIKNTKSTHLKGLIFHSDGGGQYYAKEFLKLTNKYKLENSMCKTAWENGKAERINGVIKNNYLKHKDINSFAQLVQQVDRSVYLYNTEKPHISLQRKSPVEFEKTYICNGQKADGDKSTTEIKTHPKGYVNSSPAGWDKKASGSNVILEIKTKISNNSKQKMVNVI
jgi:transposase InsO family protein